MTVSPRQDSRCRRLVRRSPESCSCRVDAASSFRADRFSPSLPPSPRNNGRSREDIGITTTNTIGDQDAEEMTSRKLCSRISRSWHKTTRGCRRRAAKSYHVPFFAYLLCLLLFRTTSTFMGPPSSSKFFAQAEPATTATAHNDDDPSTDEHVTRDLQFGLRPRPNFNRMQYCSRLAFQLCNKCRDSTKKLVKKGKCSPQKKRRKCKAKFKGCLKPRNPGRQQRIARQFKQHCDNRLLVKKPIQNVFVHSNNRRRRRGRSRFDYRKMLLRDWCPTPNMKRRRNNGGGGGPIARDNCGREVEYFAEFEVELDLYCPVNALGQPEQPQNERDLMEAGLLEYLNTESACENIVENQGDECEQIIFETSTIIEVIVGEDCRPFYESLGIPFPARRLFATDTSASKNNHRGLQRRRKTRVKKRTSGRCRTRKKKCRRKKKRRFLRASFDTVRGLISLSEDTSNAESTFAVDARGLQTTVPLPSPVECAQNTITESIVSQEPILFRQIVDDEEISFEEDIPCERLSDECVSSFRCCRTAGCKCDVGSETSCNAGTTFGEEVNQCYLNKDGLPGTISSIQDNLCCDIDPGPPIAYRYECAEGICDPLPVAICSSQEWIVPEPRSPREGTFRIDILIDIFDICPETLSNTINAQSLLQSTMEQFFRNAIQFAGCNAFVQVTTVQILSTDTSGCGVGGSQFCLNPNNGQGEPCVGVRARIDGTYTNGLRPKAFPVTIFYDDLTSARRLESVGSVGASRILDTVVDLKFCDEILLSGLTGAVTCIIRGTNTTRTLNTPPPTPGPTISPSGRPSVNPTASPTASPEASPSFEPTIKPSSNPSGSPTPSPTKQPSSSPSASPESLPSSFPSSLPTARQSSRPSALPSLPPSAEPTALSEMPSSRPSTYPSIAPSRQPSKGPSLLPSKTPSLLPSSMPSSSPSLLPSSMPSSSPSLLPSVEPSSLPSLTPSQMPSTCDDGTGVGSCTELKERILNATDPNNRAEIELCNDVVCTEDLDMTSTYFRLSCRYPPCQIDLNGNGFVTQDNGGAGSDFYAIFEDLTITGGDAENRNRTHKVSGTKKRGGAISALGTRNLTSCIELINTTVRDSCAPIGGAIYARNGGLIIRDSQCLNNTAKNGRGGCARIAGYGNSTIEGSQFQYNCAQTSGGALYYFNGIYETPEEVGVHMISNSLFLDNEVKDSYGAGGAISMIFSGEYSFNNVEFRRNSAGDVGGALYFSEEPYDEYDEERRRRLAKVNQVKPRDRRMIATSLESISSFQRQMEVLTDTPTSEPSAAPSVTPTSRPSMTPTTRPSSDPSPRPSNQPSMSPSALPSSPPSIITPIFEARFVGAKFADNVARGEEYLPPAGHDIFIEDYIYECEGPCDPYVEITCDDSTEFCDACNSTDYTSTIWELEPLDICTNSVRDENKTCIGDTCTINTCEEYFIPTNVTCDVETEKCCIEGGSACSEEGPDRCCGAYECYDEKCVIDLV